MKQTKHIEYTSLSVALIVLKYFLFDFTYKNFLLSLFLCLII